MNGWTGREKVLLLCLLAIIAAGVTAGNLTEALTLQDVTVEGTFRTKGTSNRFDGASNFYGDTQFGNDASDDVTFNCVAVHEDSTYFVEVRIDSNAYFGSRVACEDSVSITGGVVAARISVPIIFQVEQVRWKQLASLPDTSTVDPFTEVLVDSSRYVLNHDKSAWIEATDLNP